MINLSASLIKDFLVCQKRAYFRINYTGQSEQTKEMALGSLVHSVLETNWKIKEEAVKAVTELAKQYNLTTGLEKAYSCVDNFFEIFASLFSDEDKIEYLFRVPFSSEVILIGKIDRIHNHAIYDYKTSSRDPKDIDSDIQFILYYLAYAKIFSRLPAGVFQVSLQTKKLHKFTPQEKNIKKLEHEIIPLVTETIKKGVFEMNGYPKACKHCSFHKVCRGVK